MCTNPECFRMKEVAAHERWRETHTFHGEGLSYAENAELWNESGVALTFHSPYVELNQSPEASELRGDVDSVSTWKVLIKNQAVPLVLGRDTAGRVHELVSHELAKKAAHLNGHKIFRDSERETRTDSERSSTATAPALSRDERSETETLETKRENEIEAAISQAEIAAIVEAAEGKVRNGMLQIPKPFWETCAATLASTAYDMGHLGEILKRRGPEWTIESIVDEIKKLTLGQQLGFVTEVLVRIAGVDESDIWAGVFGVKLAAVRKKAEKAARVKAV